jgi:hypothetical protein
MDFFKLKFACDIICALYYLHEKNILLLDLDLNNILLEKKFDGAKIFNFNNSFIYSQDTIINYNKIVEKQISSKFHQKSLPELPIQKQNINFTYKNIDYSNNDFIDDVVNNNVLVSNQNNDLNVEIDENLIDIKNDDRIFDHEKIINDEKYDEKNFDELNINNELNFDEKIINDEKNIDELNINNELNIDEKINDEKFIDEMKDEKIIENNNEIIINKIKLKEIIENKNDEFANLEKKSFIALKTELSDCYEIDFDSSSVPYYEFHNSPEMLDGKVSKKSDIYIYGGFLYEVNLILI